MKQQEFAKRRRQLIRMMADESIAIVPSAVEKIRNRDVEYPFRQDSDFQYLTGFGEPDAVAVLIPGREPAEYVLFCRERDPLRESWNGRRAGQEGAIRDFGADDAFPITDIDDILPGLMEKAERVFYTMGTHAEFDRRVIDWVNQLRASRGQGAGTPQEFVSLEPFLHDMRLYKNPVEIELMRRAGSISSGAHERAMRVCRPGMHEYELEAELLHEFHRHGTQVAYSSIVGGGENGCILHYTENEAVLNDGELVLIDAGCEVEGYASDITRTFPINGRFTKEQRTIYDLVLQSQYAAIEAVRPGNHWNRPHEIVLEELTAGLVELGLLQGSVEDLIADQAYRRFYMHRTGHWLGLDVHDVGSYRIDDQWRELEPGMTLTVEPGLYIPAGSEGVDEKWWDIGVRIEDDVLVTNDEPDVLTGDLLKDPEEIERLMQRAKAA